MDLSLYIFDKMQNLLSTVLVTVLSLIDLSEQRVPSRNKEISQINLLMPVLKEASQKREISYTLEVFRGLTLGF